MSTPVARWRPSPMLLLFLASFAMTFVLQYRGYKPLPAFQTPAAPFSASMLGTAGHAASVTSRSQAQAAPPEARSLPAAPPGTTHDQFAPEIEAAITSEDSNQRAGAIAALSRAPAVEALAALEQVLRTDDDAGNRSLAMQVLLQLPDAGTVRGSLLPLLREFMGDADGRVAELARQGYARMSVAKPDRSAA